MLGRYTETTQPLVGRIQRTETSMTENIQKRYIIDQQNLPDNFPTHKHEANFWESLGRAVATFGFLEEILSKAIFVFTGTRQYREDEIDQAYKEWLPKLERALFDPLGNLIDVYGKAVSENSSATIENLEELISDLRKAAKIRNVLCHGSWRLPDSCGASVPFFVNRQKEIFETAIDISWLDQAQQHVASLACEVINTVTHMGWQFPGSNGPGKIVWETSGQT